MTEIVVEETVFRIPDSIEPYIGFKYLSIQQDGQLQSIHPPAGHFEWNWGKRVEARCAGVYGWEAHHFRPDDAANYSEEDIRRSQEEAAAAAANNMYYSSGIQATAPTTRLPAGQNWYFVQRIHTPADDDCGCGIYVVEDASHCSRYAADDRVLVEVALWGKTVIGDSGARGQYAYPKAFHATKKNLARALAAGELYGVPVIAPEDAPREIQEAHEEAQEEAKAKKGPLPKRIFLSPEFVFVLCAIMGILGVYLFLTRFTVASALVMSLAIVASISLIAQEDSKDS